MPGEEVVMAETKLMTVINFLHEQLKDSGITVSKIILFGSQARETATDESDIDVVVISTDFENRDLWERTAMLKTPVLNTIDEFIVPLDIIPMTPEELERRGSIIAGYARKGVVVVAA